MLGLRVEKCRETDESLEVVWVVRASVVSRCMWTVMRCGEWDELSFILQLLVE